MIFSAHVVDTGPLSALRRKTPTADTVPGLLSARNATAAPFTRGLLPRPQLGREVLVACWEDDDAIDGFLGSETGAVFGTGWTVRMELVRAAGVWPGLDHDMVAEAGDKVRGMTGPSIAITIGNAYVRSLVPFLRVNNGLEDQFMDSDGTRWGTLATNVPQLLVATLTIWDSPDAAVDYMKTGAHGQAMVDHYDPAKDPTGHTFVTGGGFFGFRPLSVDGEVGGKNPLPADLLAV